MTTERKPYREVLMPKAERIANETIRSINQTVPKSIEGMKYARQYVLEEVIKLLEQRV